MSTAAGNIKPHSKVAPQNEKAKKAALPRKYLGKDFPCAAEAKRNLERLLCSIKKISKTILNRPKAS